MGGYDCLRRVDRQTHHPPAHRVILPTTVIAAWSVTNHSKLGALSKKCQVQAHIALTNEGNIPAAKAHQARSPVSSPERQISQMARIHSITLEVWTIQVGKDRTCIG